MIALFSFVSNKTRNAWIEIFATKQTFSKDTDSGEWFLRQGLVVCYIALSFENSLRSRRTKGRGPSSPAVYTPATEANLKNKKHNRTALIILCIV